MLVDTNVLSELMRPRPQAAVLRWADSVDRVALSVITLEELWYGIAARRSARLSAWLTSFLDEGCDVLPVTPAIARRSAQLRAAGRERGRPRTQADMLIAATAWEHGLTLVTRNTRDFDGCGVALLDPFKD